MTSSDHAAMSRREALERAAGAGAGMWVLGLLPALAQCTRGGDRDSGPPNFVFIFSDDHAPQAISAYGSRINRTPNIDRIADEGAIFLNSFCTNSICAPSRAVVLTGKHSHVNGTIDNSPRHAFDLSQPTFDKALQTAGYETAVIGKWHLRVDPESFDFWRVLPDQGDYYNPDFRTPDGVVRLEGYVTDLITDLSIDWLANHRDPSKPFLLMSQHKAPHRNWMPGPDHLLDFDDLDIPEPDTLFDDYRGRASPAADQEMTIADHLELAEDLKITDPQERDDPFPGYARMTPSQKALWDAAYEPRNARFREADPRGADRVRWLYQRYIKDYLRCVAGLDDNVGRLLDHLDSSGLAHNTVVIYCSDQGFFLGEHGWYDKRWMYEQSLRMPFMVRWPGRIEPGTRIDQMIQNIDYAPTFLELAGVAVPDDVQGESLRGFLVGEPPGIWRDSIYYHYYEFPGPHRVAPHYGVRTERYKLVYYYTVDEWELFDLMNDPMELNSVYGDPAHTEVVTELKQELRRLRERYLDTTGLDFT